jgi:hypothetical protein
MSPLLVEQPPEARTGDAARVAGELARARRAAIDAERAANAPRPALATQAQAGGSGSNQIIVTQRGEPATVTTTTQGVIEIRDAQGNVVSRIDPAAIAREAAEVATTTISVPPPIVRRPSDDIPDGVLRLIVIVMSIVAGTILGVTFMRMLSRRADRRAATAPHDPEIGRRLDRIEQAIEAMAEEVERVSEAQRYSARLLTERLPELPVRSIAAADQVR